VRGGGRVVEADEEAEGAHGPAPPLRRAHGDAREPRAQRRRFAQRVDPAQRLDEGVLQHVVDLGAPPQHAPGGPRERGAMPPKRVGEIDARGSH